MKVLHEGYDRSCNDILKALSSHFLNIDPAAIRRSLELIVRLWLTLNTRSSEILAGAVFAGERALEWNVNTSLSTLIEEHFVKRAVSPRFKKPGNVDPTFTAAYLVNICSMHLRWTDDISSHLKFDLRKAALTVYRHKICLVNHLNNQEKCPIARDLLAEILDTMNLLFPFGDKETRQLLSREGQTSIYSLGGCGRIREPDLSHYEYFGEAFESLIEYFDRQPRTWRQLALDRRNKLEWSAFWVTIMVAVLTVVSIPCNIIQAMYSVKAYHVALDQVQKELARQA